MLNEGRTPLDDERRELARRHRPLADRLAGRVGALFPALADDARGEAALALVKSAADFDASKGVKFATYAYHKVQGALREMKRNELPRGLRNRRGGDGTSVRVESVADVGALVESAGASVVGRAPDRPVGSGIEDAEEVDALLRATSPRNAELLRARYAEGASPRTIAARMAVCLSQYHNLKNEALSHVSDAARHRDRLDADALKKPARKKKSVEGGREEGPPS